MFKTTIIAAIAALSHAVDIEAGDLGSATHTHLDALSNLNADLQPYDPCPGVKCAPPSVLDPDCCKCIVGPCITKDCEHEHEWWNPVTCMCECKLLRPGFECPAGSVIDEECCECIIKDVCDLPCLQGFEIDNETCTYVRICEAPPVGQECPNN
jgi:hypothetical protein